jgi:PAS domain S-box-containing protein/putative nucleotidyltransferase with HDIG domain
MKKKRVPQNKNQTGKTGSVNSFDQAYAILVENAPDGIVIIQDRIIKFANKRQSEMSGYAIEELIGKSILDLVPADFISIIQEKFSQHEQGKDISETFYVRLLRKDGTINETEFSTKLIQYEGMPAFVVITRNIAARKQEEEKFQQTINNLRKAVDTTVQVLVSAMESREPYMTSHQSRAANLACAIATEMGMDQEKIEGIRMAGVIHDIGKLTVPVEVLAKPTKLSELGFSLVKEHARSGYEMLKNIGSPWPLAQIVHQHHERMNGSGYPRKLKGDEILMEARILAVADVVEAMASHRPYRSASSINVALEEIEKNKGSLYDRTVADACLRLFREKGYQLA